jgi:Enoyl-(Acyl carrier protein) reductase
MRRVLHSKFWTNWMIGRHAAAKLREGGSITFTSGTRGAPAGYLGHLRGKFERQRTGSRARVRAGAPPSSQCSGTNFHGYTVLEGSTGRPIRNSQGYICEGVPLKRLGTIEEVASTYIHLMTNGFITGQVLAVDGGAMLRK